MANRRKDEVAEPKPTLTTIQLDAIRTVTQFGAVRPDLTSGAKRLETLLERVRRAGIHRMNDAAFEEYLERQAQTV